MYLGKSIALLLIASGIGYFVCAKAEEQKKGFVKQLGYWVGSIIIIASLLASVCSIYCHKAKKECLKKYTSVKASCAKCSRR